MDLKKYKNKAKMKECKMTTLLKNDSGKEKQEDYPTTVASGVGVVFLSFFSTIVS